jgi:hypothetical protein
MEAGKGGREGGTDLILLVEMREKTSPSFYLKNLL